MSRRKVRGEKLFSSGQKESGILSGKMACVAWGQLRKNDKYSGAFGAGNVSGRGADESHDLPYFSKFFKL